MEQPPESAILIDRNDLSLDIQIPRIYDSISTSIYPKIIVIVLGSVLNSILLLWNMFDKSGATRPLISTAFQTLFFLLFLLVSLPLLTYTIDELLSTWSIKITRDRSIKFKKYGSTKVTGIPPSILRIGFVRSTVKILSVIECVQISNFSPIDSPFFQILTLKCQKKKIGLSWFLTPAENEWLKYEIDTFLDRSKNQTLDLTSRSRQNS